MSADRFLTGVVCEGERFAGWRRHALNLVVGKVRFAVGQAVAEVSLHFSATRRRQRRSGRNGTGDRTIDDALQLASIGVGSIDRRTIGVLKLRGLTDDVFLITDGVSLTVRGQRGPESAGLDRGT